MNADSLDADSRVESKVCPPGYSLTLPIAHFHSSGTSHRPDSAVHLGWRASDAVLNVRFDVADRYVLARHLQPQSLVCCDSCVEFFFSPKPGLGYINIETNCIGTALVHWHATGEREVSTPVSDQQIASLQITTSLEREKIDPQRDGPCRWWLAYEIPLAWVESVVGQAVEAPTQPGRWRGNFYKCADETSHPHWGSWVPIGQKLDFHKPECFAQIVVPAAEPTS